MDVQGIILREIEKDKYHMIAHGIWKNKKTKKETEKWTLRYREEIGGYEMDRWNGWRGSKGTKFQL